MAINANRIVQVTPRVSNPAAESLEMNGVLLSKSEKLTPEMPVVGFSSSAEVAEFFGSDSPEYRAAAVYFLGFDGSAQKPTALYVGRWIDKDADAYIQGNAIPVDWPTYDMQESNGSLTLSYDGETLEVDDIDLSEATSFSDMAEKVQSAINTAPEGPAEAANTTVSFSAATNAFTISAPNVENLRVTGGNLAERMGFTALAIVAPAVHKQSLTDAMNKLAADTPGWVGFSTTWETTAEEAVELAIWSGGQLNTTLYVHWTGDPEVGLLHSTKETVIDALTDANVEATLSVFAPDCQLAGFVLGCIGSIAYDGNEGTATLAFRQAPGVATTVSDTQTAAVFDSKKVNYYGRFATRNSIFDHFYSGRMYGEYGWADPYLNSIWLNNSLTNAIMAGFRRNNRVPYNDEGYTIVRGWLMGTITTALRNGVIDTGLTLSEAQRAEIIREAKQDITTDLETLGYYVQIQDPGAEARGNRQSPIVNFWYTYAGSVHKLNMGSIAIL